MVRNFEKRLKSMSLREKIGQCFTIGYNDSIIKAEVVKAVKLLNCGGLRLIPWEREGLAYKKGEERTFKGGAIDEQRGRRMGSAVYATPGQYAELLNRYQSMALEREHPVPLHYSIDQEGDSYNDYIRGGVNLFPSNMGLAATGDPGLAYEVFKAIGRQLSAIGVNFIHSPVLDVNTNPRNPEINFRSFSDDPRLVGEFGVAALKGLAEGDVTAVAKHFPGRGFSAEDAHYDLIYYRHNGRQMREIDLLPYRMLIENGLRSVMIAHTVYPGLGDPENPASVSHQVVTRVLREELGFQGIITTDSITMRGLMNKFGLARACELAFKAGNDLILYRGGVNELFPVIDYLEKAVRKGDLDEGLLNRALARVWGFKEEKGLFARPYIETGKADRPLRDPEIIRLSETVPARTAILIKKGKAFPLKAKTRVLVAEQLNRFAWQCNDVGYHPGLLYEYLEALADPERVDVVECTMAGRQDLPRVKERAKAADVIVATSYYCRTVEHNLPFIRKIARLGKPVIVVTNNPYLCKKLMFCDTVLLIFSGNPRGLKAVSQILHEKVRPSGRWPLKDYPRPRPE